MENSVNAEDRTSERLNLPEIELAGVRQQSLIKDSKKSHILTYMLSGWIGESFLDEQSGGTTSYTIACPDDYYAVRLAFPNVGREPWTLERVVGHASSSYNDYINPVGHGVWVDFHEQATTQSLEECNDQVGRHRICVRPFEDPRLIAEGRPRWTWTDWAPICSNGSDEETGLRVLMIRGLIPSGQKVSYALSQMRNLVKRHQMNGGFDAFIGGLKFNIDRVNKPNGPETTEAWVDNQLAVGSLFPMVQFLTKSRGITCLVAGDSHQQGTTSTDQVASFAYRAVTQAMSRLRDRVPMGLVSTAQGGLTSPGFFGRLHDLLDTVAPSIVILPGWAYNDQRSGIHATRELMEAFLGRLVLAAEACRGRGIRVIFLTPFPRDASRMTEVQIEPWLWLRREIIGLLSPDDRLIDASLILGKQYNDTLDGTYRTELTSDGAHPDDAGHQAVAEQLAKILL